MNTIEKLGEDGFPVYGADFKLVEGLRVGMLTVNKRVPHPEGKSGAWWQCTCDCGAVVIKRSDNIKAGGTRGGSAAQKNKGCRTCGAESCNKSGIKNRNTKGTIESSHVDETYGGAKILFETDYIDTSNRSRVVMCECTTCKSPFPSTRRAAGSTCGCTRGLPAMTLGQYLISHRTCRSYGELAISKLLDKMGLPYVQEKKFTDLNDQARLPFDFYVEGKNGAYIIEYDGEQHFRDIGHFDFKNTRKHDLMKNQYCFANNIPIIRIPYTVTDIKEEDVNLATSKYILSQEKQKEYYNGQTR